MSEATPSVDTLRRVVDAFNAHDIDAVKRYIDEDCTLDNPRGPYP